MKLVFTFGSAETFGISILPDLLSSMVEAFLKLMKYFVIVPLSFPYGLPLGHLDAQNGQKNNPNPPD